MESLQGDSRGSGVLCACTQNSRWLPIAAACKAVRDLADHDSLASRSTHDNATEASCSKEEEEEEEEMRENLSVCIEACRV